ncbi:uncharacterized protein LOC126970201 [Leptidea sinapis]|uniref:DUF4797 domain-containing protein n=1 Tax=Leptidea sinapis TaxID=189913 RepID=A0A5E4QTG2_9NEOP|nr:uncharacterized protein LOC126970201 [Leptidea sinapis]VVD01307.1 unnamed protein product [Leptidea sinapis]
MKNYLEIELESCEKFAGATTNVQEAPKSARRESMAPKIVVCPPVEETSETTNAPRGSRLLKALSKRLSRRSADEDSLGSSSSNESMSSETGRSEDPSSSSTSDSGSDGSEPRRRHRSVVSLRRVFQHFNITSRSQSTSPVDRRQPKKQSQPKRILRSPVTYTYVRGLSGLPTQRVPRRAVSCGSMGLNR